MDIAIYVDPALTPRQRFDLRRDLAAALSDFGTLDVVVLNDAPPLLAHRALMGIRLFVRDPTAWVRFYLRAVRAAEEERYFRVIHDRARLRRLQEGTVGRP